MTTIHKLVTANRKCESFRYQLCNRKNNETNVITGWERDCKFQWKFVTCDKCLRARREKTSLTADAVELLKQFAKGKDGHALHCRHERGVCSCYIKYAQDFLDNWKIPQHSKVSPV